MKSYKHLFDICISEENRRKAIKQAKRTKRVRKMLKKRHMSDDELLCASYDWIMQYENAEHVPKVIHDGTAHKERVIIVPTLEELIVQHCVAKAMEEMFWHGMYQHSYASLPKRGARKIHKKPYQGRKPTVHDYRQMMSYLGWIDCTDTYRMYLKHIKPRVSFQRMKRYISRYDRHDDRRVYEQLVQLYLPRGGKRRGTRLHHRRKYRPPQGNRSGRNDCVSAPQHC